MKKTREEEKKKTRPQFNISLYLKRLICIFFKNSTKSKEKLWPFLVHLFAPPRFYYYSLSTGKNGIERLKGKFNGIRRIFVRTHARTHIESIFSSFFFSFFAVFLCPLSE